MKDPLFTRMTAGQWAYLLEAGPRAAAALLRETPFSPISQLVAPYKVQHPLDGDAWSVATLDRRLAAVTTRVRRIADDLAGDVYTAAGGSEAAATLLGILHPPARVGAVAPWPPRRPGRAVRGLGPVLPRTVRQDHRPHIPTHETIPPSPTDQPFLGLPGPVHPPVQPPRGRAGDAPGLQLGATPARGRRRHLLRAQAPDRPGVSLGEDLAERLPAATFQLLLLGEIGGGLRDWIMAKQASPHQAGEDGHRDGFCRRCADLYAASMALVTTWNTIAGMDDARAAEPHRVDLAQRLHHLADVLVADIPQTDGSVQEPG